jgi:HD-GYP domain-containing protein (c-di-GMP phosphodiesterase class II)
VLTGVEQNSTNANKTQQRKEKEIKDIIDIYQKDFYKTLSPFVDKFDKKTIREFYEYWSEQNKSNTRFKQELEKTWNLEMRLEKWSKNDLLFNKTKTSVKPFFDSPA